MTTLRTIEDVANHLGAAHPTNESISRRVYKDTSCGAWAKVEDEDIVGERSFRVKFERSIIGDVLCTAHRGGRALPLADLPNAARDYLCVVERERNLVFDEVSGPLATLDGDGITRRGSSTFVSFTCSVPLGTRKVFRVGSIVEGTDAEVCPETVPLPCTGDQIDKAIACVESAADDIWNETHGCEDCNDDDHDHRINPECASCGGDGVMI